MNEKRHASASQEQLVLDLDLERMSYGSSAVGRVAGESSDAGLVVFVEGGLPGDRVRAKIKRRKKNYAEAELVEVLRASPDRVSPPCPIFGKCGGCQWQHLRYEAQVREKAGILIHQLERAARMSADELRGLLTVHPAAEPFEYRSRVQVRGDKDGLGFYARGSHQIVHVDTCIVTHKKLQEAWKTFIATRPVAELAAATRQFKVEWTLTESGEVLEALNRKHGAMGFTQVNPAQNKVLVGIVEAMAAESAGGLLLDLYGGTGNLSNGLAPKFDAVFCVDEMNEGTSPSALTKPAPHTRVMIRDRVESFVQGQYWRDCGFERVDTVIMDPPRTGLGYVVNRVLELGPRRAIFVSCDPATLARDLAHFVGSESPYRINAIHLIDMFPQTWHIETVVECVKR